jgi:hypothetical protein
VSRLARVVLGDFEIVAAHGLDPTADRGPVDQLYPDRFASPGQLPEGEGELVAADRRFRSAVAAPVRQEGRPTQPGRMSAIAPL